MLGLLPEAGVGEEPADGDRWREEREAERS